MKGLIIYKGRYGATMEYSIWLGATLNFPVVKADFVKPEQLTQADYVLIGTSVYIGRLQIAGWLKNLAPLLEGEKLIYFVVGGSAPDHPEKITGYYEHDVPASLRKNAACFPLPGRLHFRQLSLKDKLLLRAGAWLAARKGESIPLADYNMVSRENLAPVIEAVRLLGTGAFTSQKSFT